MKSVKKTSDKNNTNISGEWTSTFIENNRIFNELISIKQQGKKVEATIFLDKDGKLFNYKFIGQIKNKVINGVYLSTKPDKKENGTISLRPINKDLLFGSSTFINIDEHSDIIQTPYILTRNDKNKIGSFKFCKNCDVKKNCCGYLGTGIDVALMLPPEVETIKKKYHLKAEDFAIPVNLKKIEKDKSLKTLYQIKLDPDTHTCPFFKKCKCQIYEDRPIDCRVFPFDIKLVNGKCYLIHYNSHNCHICKSDAGHVKAGSYNIRIFLRIILPYLREWSVDRFSVKLTKDRPYTIICPIEDLF